MNLMKLIFGCALFVFLMVSHTSAASLVGDEVLLTHYMPNLSTVYNGHSYPVTVETGTGDLQQFWESYTVNMEADSLQIVKLRSGTFSNFTFNGLVASGLNYETDYYLADVTIDTNFSGWDDSRMTFGDDYVQFNFAGLSTSTSQYLTASFDFQPTQQGSAIPEPLSLLLLSSAVVALLKRKK